MDQIEQVKSEAMNVVEQAEALGPIEDQETYERACELLTDVVKPLRKKVAETFEPIKKKAYDAWQETLKQMRRHDDPLAEAERQLKMGIGAWDLKQKRIAEQEEAERRRLAREAAEAQAVEEAAALERDGYDEAAQERIEQPTAPVMTQAPAPAKPKGVSTRYRWRFRVISESKVARKFMQPNQKKIAGVVSSMGPDAADLVGGIEVYQEPIVSGRASG